MDVQLYSNISRHIMYMGSSEEQIQLFMLHYSQRPSTMHVTQHKTATRSQTKNRFPHATKHHSNASKYMHKYFDLKNNRAVNV